MSIQQSKGYHLGFHHAQQGEPLFDDAAPDYRAGWLGYWEMRRLLDEVRL